MIIEEEDNQFSNSKPEEEYQELKQSEAMMNLNSEGQDDENEIELQTE